LLFLSQFLFLSFQNKEFFADVIDLLFIIDPWFASQQPLLNFANIFQIIDESFLSNSLIDPRSEIAVWENFVLVSCLPQLLRCHFFMLIVGDILFKQLFGWVQVKKRNSIVIDFLSWKQLAVMPETFFLVP